MWLDVENGESVLEVGTGTGLALHPLAESNPRGWTEGVDASAAMLARARTLMQQCSHRRYGLRCAHATALPYPSDTFDAVFSSYLIDLLPASKRRPAMREMRRVLRPKGRLVVVYLAVPQRPVEQLWEWIARAVPPLLGGSRPIDPRPVLDTTGFEEERHTTRVQVGLRSGIVRTTLR